LTQKHMDRWPTETWGHVFTHACTDDGYTGRSLSLVSRYIHEASKPMKLQSISVVGISQIHGFARLIANTPPCYRQVRYLFIHDMGRSEDEDDDDDDQGSEQPGSDQTLLFTLESIITTLAPSLTILYAFVYTLTSHPILPSSVIFPRLGELTLYCPTHRGSVLIATLESIPKIVALFPALQYLYLAHPKSENLESVIRITHALPSLTHICIRSGWSMKVINTLIDALRSKDTDGSVLPSTIERILWEPEYRPKAYTCLSALETYVHFNALKSTSTLDTRVRLLEARRVDAEDAEVYWRDTIEGRGGWWKT
jgi:hypothetical protein